MEIITDSAERAFTDAIIRAARRLKVTTNQDAVILVQSSRAYNAPGVEEIGSYDGIKVLFDPSWWP